MKFSARLGNGAVGWMVFCPCLEFSACPVNRPSLSATKGVGRKQWRAGNFVLKLVGGLLFYEIPGAAGQRRAGNFTKQ